MTRVLNTSSSPFAVTATVDTLRLGLCIRHAQGGVRVVWGGMARGVHTKLKLHHGRGQVTENVELDLELGVDLLDAVVRELHRNHVYRSDLRERPSDQQSKRTRARSSRAVPFPGDNGLILIDTYQPDGLHEARLLRKPDRELTRVNRSIGSFLKLIVRQHARHARAESSPNFKKKVAFSAPPQGNDGVHQDRPA